MKTSGFRTVDALLALLMVSGLYLSVLWGDDFTYSIFTDRDLYRAYAIGEEFQYLGSESMYHLARVPGEVMAYLFWALQAVNPSTAFIHAAAVTMNAIGLLLIPVLFRRFLGWTGALAVAA